MEHQARYQYYDVFSMEQGGGNGALVVEDLDFDDTRKRQIAARANLSETVFVKENEGRFTMTYFTPVEEVALCGHGTIAGLHFIREHWGMILESVRTRSGEVEAVFNEGIFYLHLGEADLVKELEDGEGLSEALGIPWEVMTVDGMTPRIYKSGIADVICPVRSKEILDQIEIHRDSMIQMSKNLDVVGCHVFTLGEPGVIYARNFAPLYGIDEESATGTSNNSLITFMMEKQGWVHENGVIKQGRGSLRGLLRFKIVSGRVFIGGRVARTDRIFEI